MGGIECWWRMYCFKQRGVYDGECCIVIIILKTNAPIDRITR
jgi:hypothetical protein